MLNADVLPRIYQIHVHQRKGTATASLVRTLLSEKDESWAESEAEREDLVKWAIGTLHGGENPFSNVLILFHVCSLSLLILTAGTATVCTLI